MLEKLPESVGHALINQRAGIEQVLYNELYRARSVARIQLRSSTFVFNGQLPRRYTADGDGVSPPLEWDSVPAQAESLAILVEDADSPTPHPLVHAIVVNLPGGDGAIVEGALNSPHHAGLGLAVGQNSLLRQAWLPPDPPRGHGVHRYVFQIFALEKGSPFSDVPGRREFIEIVLERAIGVGCLIGTYERADSIRTDEPAVLGATTALGAMGALDPA
jgi:Raf kinase inhibitor-like YbhB/YbcL family protein